MTIQEIERTLRRIGAETIDNSTQIGTFAIVKEDQFTTKGISNRDNARWKRAQYIVVGYCNPSNVQTCIRGFLQFSESCQFLIITNTNQVFNGNGQEIDISQLTTLK